MLRAKRIGEITLYVVDDRSLVGVLEKLGIYQDVAAGRARCYICGRPVSVESLGGLFKHEGQIRLVCNDIRCLYEAARLTAERRA